MANFNRSSLVLAVNQALWGEVTPDMRMVAARIAKGALQIRIYVDGPVTQTGHEAAARIGAACLIGDFKELKLDCLPVQLDAPNPLSLEEGWAPIYKRKE